MINSQQRSREASEKVTFDLRISRKNTLGWGYKLSVHSRYEHGLLRNRKASGVGVGMGGSREQAGGCRLGEGSHTHIIQPFQGTGRCWGVFYHCNANPLKVLSERKLHFDMHFFKRSLWIFLKKVWRARLGVGRLPEPKRHWEQTKKEQQWRGQGTNIGNSEDAELGRHAGSKANKSWGYSWWEG